MGSGGYWLGSAVRGSVSSAHALRLPLGSFPWLCLLGRACLKTDLGKVVVNSTLFACFAICRTCFPGEREPCQFLHQKQVLCSQNVYG